MNTLTLTTLTAPSAEHRVRVASRSPDGPRGSVALGAFDALQTLGVTGWEGSAIGLMYQTKTLQYSLAGVLARAGRSEGWWIVRDALTPDNVAMGVALNNTAPFHRLKSADGTTIDAVSELKRLQRDLRQRGRSAEASEIDLHVFEADKWGRRQRGPAR